MTPHHFGVYHKPPKINEKTICLPEVLTPFWQGSIFNLTANKSIDRFGNDIDCSCELVLTDASLIQDLKDFDCFIFFTWSMLYCPDINIKYWDKSIYSGTYKFLGWTISNYESGDYAFVDGEFPVVGQEKSPNEYDLSIIDAHSANEWGLIKNSSCLDVYMNKNNNIIFNYQGSPTPSVKALWNPYAIFCDEFTFNKLKMI